MKLDLTLPTFIYDYFDVPMCIGKLDSRQSRSAESFAAKRRNLEFRACVPSVPVRLSPCHSFKRAIYEPGSGPWLFMEADHSNPLAKIISIRSVASNESNARPPRTRRTYLSEPLGLA